MAIIKEIFYIFNYIFCCIWLIACYKTKPNAVVPPIQYFIIKHYIIFNDIMSYFKFGL